MSNLQLHKLKSGTKNGTEVTLNLSSNVVGDSNDKTNFPHKLILTNTQVSRIRKAFANGSSDNIGFSKTQLSKIFNEMLGPFNSFKIFKSVDNSVELYAEYLKRKKIFLSTQKR